MEKQHWCLQNYVLHWGIYIIIARRGFGGTNVDTRVRKCSLNSRHMKTAVSCDAPTAKKSRILTQNRLTQGLPCMSDHRLGMWPSQLTQGGAGTAQRPAHTAVIGRRYVKFAYLPILAPGRETGPVRCVGGPRILVVPWDGSAEPPGLSEAAHVHIRSSHQYVS